jgi:hypothetical protein
VFEVTRKSDRIVTGGSITRQINTFVIFQDCRTVRESKNRSKYSLFEHLFGAATRATPLPKTLRKRRSL